MQVSFPAEADSVTSLTVLLAFAGKKTMFTVSRVSHHPPLLSLRTQMPYFSFSSLIFHLPNVLYTVVYTSQNWSTFSNKNRIMDPRL